MYIIDEILNRSEKVACNMIEFEEYKGKLNGLKPTLENLEGALHLDAARREAGNPS